jgi:nicotinate-nucleotide adenylyltransferase
MKIGILGGSFDPPHFGHLLIAQQIIESKKVDQIWLMPNFSTSFHHEVFQKQLSSAEDRLAMTMLLENNKIVASDFEIRDNKKSITITTLEKLSEKFPQHSFYWITGSDKMETFQLYDEWQKIISDFHLIIFPRGETHEQLDNLVKQTLQLQSIPQHVIVLDNKELILSNISSSAIRKRVKKGLSIDFLVPEKVEKYIKEHNLYV